MAKKNDGRATDYRADRRRDDRNLLLLVLFVLIVVGAGMIGLVYGLGALIGSLPCLGGGAVMILLLWGLFTIVEKLGEGS